MHFPLWVRSCPSERAAVACLPTHWRSYAVVAKPMSSIHCVAVLNVPENYFDDGLKDFAGGEVHRSDGTCAFIIAFSGGAL